MENQHSVRQLVRHRSAVCLEGASTAIINKINTCKSQHKGKGRERNATNILLSSKMKIKGTKRGEFWN